MFEELFNRYPGLQNIYENQVAAGYRGDVEQFMRDYSQEFASTIPGFSAVTGIPSQAMPAATGAAMPPQTMPQQMMPQQAMPQPTMPMPSAMVDPVAMAYQRGLLSGTVQPQNPYGFGLATSPYYGYPRNPYGNLLY